MLTITREFVFDAAHRLYRKDLPLEKNREIFGKCCKMHGHTYRLRVTVSGKVDANGMIIHFSELGRIVKELIINRYDHEVLNDLEEFRDQQPTAENMVRHIFRVVGKRLAQIDVTLISVTLYETPNAWATIAKDA